MRNYELINLLGKEQTPLKLDTNPSIIMMLGLQGSGKTTSSAKLAVKLKKDFPYYWYNLGCAYLGLKEYSKAKSAFNKAIKLNNAEPDFYYNLALTYKNLKNTKKAQENLDIYNKLVKEK